MSPTKPPIKDNDFDRLIEQVDQFAAERGVPSKQFPNQVIPVGQGPIGVVPQPPLQPEPAPAVPSTPMGKITLMLPQYVIDAVAQRAVTAKPRQTQRFVYLQALRAIGIEVDEEDMISHRRPTPAASKP